MEDLIAKNVFGELTLWDVWEFVKDNWCEIEIKVSGEPISRSYTVCSDYDDELVFCDPMRIPDFSLKLEEKVKVVGEHVVLRNKRGEVRLRFKKAVPIDLSFLLPSSK
jgi:hypothetical protein